MFLKSSNFSLGAKVSHDLDRLAPYRKQAAEYSLSLLMRHGVYLVKWRGRSRHAKRRVQCIADALIGSRVIRSHDVSLEIDHLFVLMRLVIPPQSCASRVIVTLQQLALFPLDNALTA